MSLYGRHTLPVNSIAVADGVEPDGPSLRDSVHCASVRNEAKIWLPSLKPLSLVASNWVRFPKRTQLQNDFPQVITPYPPETCAHKSMFSIWVRFAETMVCEPSVFHKRPFSHIAPPQVSRPSVSEGGFVLSPSAFPLCASLLSHFQRTAPIIPHPPRHV